jgi:hypothetical protein
LEDEISGEPQKAKDMKVLFDPNPAVNWTASTLCVPAAGFFER